MTKKRSKKVIVIPKTKMPEPDEKGKSEILNYLFDNRSEGYYRDDMDDENNIEDYVDRAIVLAASRGHLEIVKQFHKNHTEKITSDAMDFAAEHGHLEVVKFLHENRTEGCTKSAMDWAAKRGHLEVVKYLSENRTEGCTKSAMDWAASRGHLEVVKFLHENRTEGCTTQAMDWAAESGHLEVVRWFRKNRAECCTTSVVNAYVQETDITENLLKSQNSDKMFSGVNDIPEGGLAYGEKTNLLSFCSDSELSPFYNNDQNVNENVNNCDRDEEQEFSIFNTPEKIQDEKIKVNVSNNPTDFEKSLMQFSNEYEPPNVEEFNKEYKNIIKSRMTDVQPQLYKNKIDKVKTEGVESQESLNKKVFQTVYAVTNRNVISPVKSRNKTPVTKMNNKISQNR